MATASSKTLLSLDRFAKVAGIHPLHFNQVVVPEIAEGSTCDVPILQYSWQAAGRIGREDIAEAIAQAEDMIRGAAGFLPAVDWTLDEPALSVRPANPLWYNGPGMDVRGQLNTVRTGLGYVWMGGQKGKSIIEAAAPIVYSDTDGDGYFETATIVAATTVTDTQEIALYYPGLSGVDAWEIRPLRSVVIAGGVATITCRREQLVLPGLLETLTPGGVNGLTNANFLTTIDVYRLYNDPSVQAQTIWDRIGGVCCTSDDCAACAFGVAAGCLTVRIPRVGMVSVAPGTWDAENEGFTTTGWAECRSPDRLKLWYRSGWKNTSLEWPYRQMDPLWERAITYLAMSLLERPLCACEPLESAFRHWREDLSHNESTPGKSSSWQVSRGKLENPFGMTRGALYAWDVVSRYAVGNA